MRIYSILYICPLLIATNHVPYACQDVNMSIVQKGVVVAGEYSGWSIFVVDDSDGDTAGYYLYLKSDAEGFDYWFEYEAGLQAQLADFEVKWMD